MDYSDFAAVDAVLRSTDAIMRPDIKDLLCQYAALGGDLPAICGTLVEAYRGFPHLIDVVASVLEQFSDSPRSEIESQVENSLVELFKPDEMDAVFLKSDSPPKWVRSMIDNPVWASGILRLAGEHPKSFFIAYFLNSLAIRHPERVKFLPPGLVTYQSYSSVWMSLVQRLALDKSLRSELFRLITTDD
jgi:hypothetical protein